MAQKLASRLQKNQAFASVRYVGISPQKARLVADLVRGRKAAEALTLLRFTSKAAAEPMSKVIASAVANATENKQLSLGELVVSQVWVDEAPTREWRRFAARGRFRPLLRRACHINVVVSEAAPEETEE
jgi:large subunit ribosomal protein L22